MKEKSAFLCDRAIEFVMTREIEELATLTIAKIANTLKVSQSYLTRLFKHQRNLSLGKYLFREKMLRAALILITEQDLTIKELSRKMGFIDCEYFGAIFKEHFGISPGKFRDCKKTLEILKKVNQNKNLQIN